MVKDLTSYSDCGQYLAHCGVDGKLKIWDTISGNLKQEYVPNLHLNSPCSCIQWIYLSEKSIYQNQKRKRKLKGKTTKVIALGTKNGSIALYNLAEGQIILTLEDKTLSGVRDLSWSREGGLYSVDGTHVVQWDLENKSVRSKWKCKGGGNRIAVSPNGEICLTANVNISLWDVNTKKCIRTYIGHSNVLCTLNFINDNYFLSCGINDRHIAAWSTTLDEATPIARFSVGDNIKGEISVLLEDKTILQMVAVTNGGNLVYFNQQLNGKVTKSIKPIQRVEFVDNTSDGEVNSTNILPIICAHIKASSNVSAAYGYTPLFGFETFNVSLERENQIIRVSKPTAKCLKVTPTNCEGTRTQQTIQKVEYTNRVATAGVKRKLGATNEVSMEQRLGNLCIDIKDSAGIASTSAQNVHNLSHLLIQGLDSKDKTILDSVLLRRDPKVIEETVASLPIHALVPLVQELKKLMQGRILAAMVATDWLKVVLKEHASQLLAVPTIQEYLTSIQSIIDAKLCFLAPLGSLSGRLGHLLQQLDTDGQGWRNLADIIEPVVLYQEQDSSDEGGSLLDGDYESEDKWDELSDQELESEPSS